jgi:hypothetical protein
VRRSRRWCLLAFSGVYGGREIINALRTSRGPRRTFYPLVFILCIFGLERMFPWCQLAMMISLYVFPFLVR